MKVPLTHPKPDVENFKQTILRKRIPQHVPFIELHIDKEIIAHIAKNLLNRKWVEPLPSDRKTQEEYLKNYIECNYRLGYDYVRPTSAFRFSAGLAFASRTRKGKDTATLAKKERSWIAEKGLINSWEDFEKYPWPSPNESDLWPYEFISQNLPEGMGFFACPGEGIFETLSNELIGYENLAYLLYDEPQLVRAVFERVGELILAWYENIIGLENMIGFFQGDDLGFRTSTLISPEDLKKYVLPWHKKIAQLAHEHNLLYLLHSCGNLEQIMEELIEDVRIDGKHSFEDEIMPVGEFKRKYGDRVGVLGGVDVDKLCRLSEEELRQYVRNILEQCAVDGGYALGSGNSIANYVPVKNYLIMLEEGLNYN